MKLIRSVLTGLAAVAAIVVFLPFLLAWLTVHFLSQQPKGDTYFVVWHLRSPQTAMAALVIFLLGFGWQFRRLSRKPEA